MIEILNNSTPVELLLWTFVVGWGARYGVMNTLRKLRSAIAGERIFQSSLGATLDSFWYLCIIYLCVFTFKLLG